MLPICTAACLLIFSQVSGGVCSPIETSLSHQACWHHLKPGTLTPAPATHPPIFVSYIGVTPLGKGRDEYVFLSACVGLVPWAWEYLGK
ncbi:hypothetical protein DFP73DRAFT_180502 [Morchella snyderi]|nr:hypothetical protein DFP73DRAFT_180502 [Morchella snyderi]